MQRNWYLIISFTIIPIDYKRWTPNNCHDNKVEVFCINNTLEYLLKQSRLGRNTLTRLAQIESEMSFEFKHHSVSNTSTDILSFMIDGEFYEVYRPKCITISHCSDAGFAYNQ